MRKFFYLYLLHALNDGFEGSLLLFLPFIAKDMHINLTQVGFLGSSENITRVLLAVPAIYVARKLGALKTLIFLVLIYSLSFLAVGISQSFFMLIAMFVFAGLGFGMFNTIGLSLASHWSNNKNKTTQMGLYSSSGDYGNAIISSAAVFLAARAGWRQTSLLYGIIGIVVFLILRIFIHAKVEQQAQKVKPNKHVSLISFLKDKKFLIANATNLFDSLGGSALYLFLPFLLLHKNIVITTLAFFTGAYFLGNLLGKVILGKISDIFDNTTTLIFSEISMAILMITLVFTSFVPIIFVSCFLLGIFAKGTVPVIKTMVSQSAQHHGNFDKAFGLNLIVGGTAVTLAPLIFGYLSNNFGIPIAFMFSTGCSLVAIIPAYLYKISD